MENFQFQLGGGSANLEILKKIEDIEQELVQLKQTIASDTTYGLTKVTSATDITQESGIALSAIQNNPIVDGTLSNKILKKETKVKIINFTLQTQQSGENYYGSMDVSKISGFPKTTFLAIPMLASMEGYFHYMPSIGMSGFEFRIFNSGSSATFGCFVACL